MKTLLITIVLGLTMSSLARAENAQPSKTQNCTAQAQDLDATERKAFMKTCLGNAAASAAPMSQRDKMKKCNADAKGIKGGERRQFMSHCLSKNSAG